MKALGALCILCLLFTAPNALAEPPVAGEAMSHLSRSAQEELAKSIDELNQLRDQIATEKLPLAQELTAAEEKVSNLRREHERIVRLVDEGNLELITIKAGLKARQDELTYIGTLLDEYARTFESKVNVSELQSIGAAIESAKQAPDASDLSIQEKFARQTDLVGVSIARLFEAIGGMRFAGVAVDLQGAVVRGQFAVIGPVTLFRADRGGAAGLAIPQSGSPNPLVRPLDGAMQAGLDALVQTGVGVLPLDPSGGGALEALVQRASVVHIFKKGGPVMWPLLFASVLALGTVLERLLFLMMEKFRRRPKVMGDFFTAVANGDMDRALEIGRKSKYYLVRALGYALSHKETSLESALLYAQSRELKRYRRGIPILDTVITLAPLLGLLGTVTGMMGSFSLIGGELGSPGAITGGIAEALIATAFGLGIAITALLPFNFLNTRLEEARHEMESAATQLELLVHHPGSVKDGAAPSAPNIRDEETLRRRRELQRKRREISTQIAELQAALEGEELATVAAAQGGEER